MLSNANLDNEALNCKNSGLEKLQALYRGNRARKSYVPRALAGEKIVCPFVSCEQDIIIQILDIIRDFRLSSDYTFVDLGSGDGKVLIEVARMSCARCIGYELDEVKCSTANRRIAESGLSSRVHIIHADIMDADLSCASVIFTFLLPSCMKNLSEKFLIACAPGTLIISYKFKLPESDGWTPIKVFSCRDIVNPRGCSQHSACLYAYFSP